MNPSPHPNSPRPDPAAPAPGPNPSSILPVGPAKLSPSQRSALLDQALDMARQLESMVDQMCASARPAPTTPGDVSGETPMSFDPTSGFEERMALGDQLSRDLHDLAMELSPEATLDAIDEELFGPKPGDPSRSHAGIQSTAPSLTATLTADVLARVMAKR